MREIHKQRRGEDRSFWQFAWHTDQAYWLLFGIGIITVALFSIELHNQAHARYQSISSSLRPVVIPKVPVTIELPGAEPILALIEDYESASSLWRIVNHDHPLPMDYTPAETILSPVEARGDKSSEERSVRPELKEPLSDMFEAAAADGHELMIGSAYRSPELQQTYYSNYVSALGVEQAQKFSALPGHSEHQTGLAVDISTKDMRCYLDECFTNLEDGQWLAKNSYKYGFLLRYPEDKTHITKYNFEPWHYRYVGKELATALFQSNLTLEEAQPYIDEALEKVKKRL